MKISKRIKWEFFQAVVMSVLLYDCTNKALTTRFEKKLIGNSTRILLTILNQFWKTYPTEELLYCHLLSISKAIQARPARRADYCWDS